MSKRDRTLKNNMYINERNLISVKLCTILGISKINNYFHLYDIDNDINIQKEIIELKSDIRKYFSCSQWTCFKEKDVKREYLTILKAVFKSTNKQVISTGTVINRDGKKIKTQKYVVIFD